MYYAAKKQEIQEAFNKIIGGTVVSISYQDTTITIRDTEGKEHILSAYTTEIGGLVLDDVEMEL